MPWLLTHFHKDALNRKIRTLLRWYSSPARPAARHRTCVSFFILFFSNIRVLYLLDTGLSPVCLCAGMAIRAGNSFLKKNEENGWLWLRGQESFFFPSVIHYLGDVVCLRRFSSRAINRARIYFPCRVGKGAPGGCRTAQGGEKCYNEREYGENCSCWTPETWTMDMQIFFVVIESYGRCWKISLKRWNMSTVCSSRGSSRIPLKFVYTILEDRQQGHAIRPWDQEKVVGMKRSFRRTKNQTTCVTSYPFCDHH